MLCCRFLPSMDGYNPSYAAAKGKADSRHFAMDAFWNLSAQLYVFWSESWIAITSACVWNRGSLLKDWQADKSCLNYRVKYNINIYISLQKNCFFNIYCTDFVHLLCLCSSDSYWTMWISKNALYKRGSTKNSSWAHYSFKQERKEYYRLHAG